MKEDLQPADVGKILDQLKRGETPKPGPYNGRVAAEPVKGRKTLIETPPGPGANLRTDGAL